jgi:hypothetical protein
MFVLALAWLLLASIGFAGLARYGAKSGESQPAPSDWPADTRVAFAADHSNIVMAIHPRCPCSQASLEELARLLPKCPRDVHLSFLVWRGASLPAGWEKASVAELAARFPAAAVFIDTDGAEAERFGAATSGHLVLFGKEGRMLFSGGVTAARGHEGACPSQDALLARLQGETRLPYSSPVFGCPLRGPHARRD